jgi:hypothetical protein
MAIQTLQTRAGFDSDKGCAKCSEQGQVGGATERCALEDGAHGDHEFIEAQRARAQDKR